jgi:predicted RecB family nuclease
MAQGLSKSRVLAGVQCLRQLWWRVHEPDAPELEPTEAEQAVFERGREVGEAARRHVPGGVLIPRDSDDLDAALEATRTALAAKPPAIYEAAFLADDVFVAVDVLERARGGWNVVEVKSSTEVKDVHVFDAAIQVHVLRQAGVKVKRAEVMVLNRDCVFPHLEDLFLREDVTEHVEEIVGKVPRWIRAERRALAGPLPEVEVGDHCDEPYECPFRERCWPELPAHHVSTLYMGRRFQEELHAAGCETLHDVPGNHPLGPVQRRQVRAVKAGRMIVEKGLSDALKRIGGTRAYLDFETLMPAIPRWDGCRPYDAVPAQFVCYVKRGRSSPVCVSYLAEGGADPREALAVRLLEALDKIPLVLAWYATFEKRVIRELAQALPRLADDLGDLDRRTVDLLAVVRDHVYHPDFAGGFGLKRVLPVLVPDLAYDDLEIRDGLTAAGVLETLILAPERLRPAERRRLRAALDAYCRRDTYGLVRLHERLRRLARG